MHAENKKLKDSLNQLKNKKKDIEDKITLLQKGMQKIKQEEKKFHASLAEVDQAITKSTNLLFQPSM